VKSTEERVLRQRLREETSQIENGPAPVDAILRRGRAIRARRRGAAVSSVAVLAVAAAVTASMQAFGTPGNPAPVSGPGHPAGHAVTLNAADPRAPGGVFASGTAGGSPWRLAVRNIAGPAPWCLPAVMLNSRDGDILYYPPGHAPLISNTAFLTDPGSTDPGGTDPGGQPGTGYAFAEVGSGVTRLAVTLRDGTRLIVRPVTVRLCGQRFHLAGFGYPAAGIAQLAAYLGNRATFSYHPPGTLFGPRASAPGAFAGPGLWYNTKSGGSAANGPIGSGQTGGVRWRLSMSLGSAGQCYTGSASRPGLHGSAEECLPVQAPPAGAALSWVPFPATAATGLTGYAGLVSPRTGYVIAHLSDGTTRKLAPIDMGGRKYFGLAVGQGIRLARVTMYDAAGRAFASTTAIPPSG
jgi:hypothetical protein